MTKEHTITIEGLPKGWKAVLVEMESDASSYMIGERMHLMAKVVLEKIQPRRIVLEETGEDSGTIQQYFEPGFSTTLKKKWKLVKEGE